MDMKCLRWLILLAHVMLLGGAVAGGEPAGGTPEAALVGVNLAGGEFGKVPGVYDRDYAYPGPRQFDYCQAKGLTVVRLPLRWERIQPKLMDTLDEAELRRLDAAVKLAAERDLKILLDVHNYARYYGQVIGTPEVPNEAFADFWQRLAAHYSDEAAVCGLGLMNEPHDTGGRWPAAAQAAIDAIRKVNRRHAIFVCGDGWSGAHSWKKINANLLLNDPAGKLVYEAHQYFDRDHSGTYKQSYDDSGAHPLIGVERLRPFAEWLREHKVQGFIGEFGVPDDDPRWLEVLDNFLAAMKAEGIGGAYWAAGGWWGKYPLSVEPRDGRDRPQMEVLGFYAGDREKPSDAKPSYADAAARMKTAPPRTAESKKLPAGAERTVYDLSRRAESYDYRNDASEYRSEAVEDAGRPARRIAYRHQGEIAWVGAGLYFGGLDCQGYTAFKISLRAEKPCKLEVKAYHSDKAVYRAVFAVGDRWQEIVVPFEQLRGSDGSFDSTRRLLKVELQPSRDPKGSSLFLGEFKLTVQ
jgi:aryl-phospho-beta-D-glucosidase BglC (GH1 family)